MVVTSASHQFEAPKTYSPSTVAYNPTTGVMTITSAAHGLDNGDFVKIADNSLTFTCALDGNSTSHSYPRPTDPLSGKFFPIFNVQTNSFGILAGNLFGEQKISDQSTHIWTGATANGIVKANDKIMIEEGGLTFTCAKDNDQTNHSYPKANSNHLFHHLIC